MQLELLGSVAAIWVRVFEYTMEAWARADRPRTALIVVGAALIVAFLWRSKRVKSSELDGAIAGAAAESTVARRPPGPPPNKPPGGWGVP